MIIFSPSVFIILYRLVVRIRKRLARRRNVIKMLQIYDYKQIIKSQNVFIRQNLYGLFLFAATR